MYNLRVLVTCGVLILSVVDVQNVKPSRLESFEEKEKKCPIREEANLDVCLPEDGYKMQQISTQNGAVEKESEVCSVADDRRNSVVEPVDMDLDSDSLDSADSISRSRIGNEIRKNLSWIRWTEYSPYAKDLIKSNNWESVQGELITVVSYNVLSQDLLEKHRYLYKKNSERSLEWETRSRILLDEFRSFNADILCLQEVDSFLVNSFYNYNLNQMGYQGVFKQRTHDKLDGCAIYFKKAKFNLIKTSTVEMFKEAVHLLDRDNIGIILKLSLRSNPDTEFVIATTHLLYNPRRGDIRLAQTQLMLAEIDKMAYKKHNFLTNQPEYLPIIFTGDMNYPPENGVYQLVTKNFLEYEGMSLGRGNTLNKTLLPPRVGVTDSCQYASTISVRKGQQNPSSFSTGVLGHQLNLESVYTHVKSDLPEATTNQNNWVTVDYIFYSQLWDDNMKLRTEGNLKLMSKLTLPNSEEARVYLKHIPNMACGSDHLPLVATFHVTGNQ